MDEHRCDERSREEPVPAGLFHAGRPPRLRRVGRTVAVVAVVGFLGVLAYLTARYSHGTRPPGEEGVEARAPSLAAPLSAERIEEYARERLEEELRARRPAPGPPELALPEAYAEPFGGSPPPLVVAGPAAPPPPPPPPARELPALRSPLSPAGGRPAAPAVAPSPAPEPGFWEELRRGFPRAYPEVPARAGGSAGAPGAAAGSAEDLPGLDLPSLEVHRLERSGRADRRLLATGTVVPLVLTHELATDVPGPVRAWVTRDVYDSATHTTLLLPRGTLVTGMQSARTAPGDRRVLIAWRRLRLPSGESYVLPELPAGSVDGTAGATGEVDRHWWSRFGNAVALSLVGAATQLSQPQERTAVQGFAASEGQVVARELGLELGRLSREILRRGLDQPPTIHLPAGHRLTLLVTRDLAF